MKKAKVPRGIVTKPQTACTDFSRSVELLLLIFQQKQLKTRRWRPISSTSDSVARMLSAKQDTTVDSERYPVVVLASDEKFAMPLATTVRSAIENLSPHLKLRIFVLDGGIEEPTKARLIRSWPAGRFEVNWIRVDGSSLGGPATMQGSISCYFRILIPRVLPSNIRRAIYLDSDLLICSDLGRLWSQDLSGNLCLAVQDCGAPFIDSSQAVGTIRIAPLIFTIRSRFRIFASLASIRWLLISIPVYCCSISMGGAARISPAK